MMQPIEMQRGLLLHLYLGLSHGFPLLARRILRKRLARGKEDRVRWGEKLGQSLAPRADGTMIWLHAVGLGEVLSLRGIIARIADKRPDISFLVTSTTIASAQVFTKNLPPRTIHQFLPVDAPPYRRRFLDHFRPDLCIWAEQDIWPGFVSDIAARGIPQAIIAARMNVKSFRSHLRARSLYRDLYNAMHLITAQDDTSADHLTKLGAPAPVTNNGSLKPGAPPLSHDPDELTALANDFVDRTVWAVAPAHPADAEIAMAAHAQLRQADPSALLIVVPRFPNAQHDIAGDGVVKRSNGQIPSPDDPIWLCDTFGDLGLIYRLSKAVLIGGTFCDIEGHNPWEAAKLDTAILHGPRTAHFTDDFATLDQAGAAHRVTDANELATVLQSNDLKTLTENATKISAAASERTDALATQLISLLRSPNG